MEGEPTERPAKTGGLNRLSTIFLVVLGLHVVVIVGISAYHLLRGNPETGMTAIPETMPAPQAEVAKAPEAAATPVAEVASTMPSPDDKVWQTQESAPTEAMPPVAVAPAPTAERSHVVSKGETIAKIAKANGVTSAALIQANALKGTTVKIGQKLIIPEAAGAGTTKKAVVTASTPVKAVVTASTPVKAVVAAAAKQESSPTGSYKVAPGDTLAKIAKKFGTKADTLAKLNSITDPKKLKVGMKIQVPGEASAKAAVPVATPAPAGPTDMAMLPKPTTN
jgi:LysM repeat protein